MNIRVVLLLHSCKVDPARWMVEEWPLKNADWHVSAQLRSIAMHLIKLATLPKMELCRKIEGHSTAHPSPYFRRKIDQSTVAPGLTSWESHLTVKFTFDENIHPNTFCRRVHKSRYWNPAAHPKKCVALSRDTLRNLQFKHMHLRISGTEEFCWRLYKAAKVLQ